VPPRWHARMPPLEAQSACVKRHQPVVAAGARGAASSGASIVDACRQFWHGSCHARRGSRRAPPEKCALPFTRSDEAKEACQFATTVAGAPAEGLFSKPIRAAAYGGGRPRKCAASLASYAQQRTLLHATMSPAARRAYHGDPNVVPPMPPAEEIGSRRCRS